jgi:hypothetical protein
MTDELVTVGVHDYRAIEVDGPSGRRYKARDGGLYDMLPSDAAALVREGGFRTGVGGAPAGRPGGHVCGRCGRHNFIKKCGRCELDADRAALRSAGFDYLADEGIAYPMRYEALGEWGHVDGEQ